MAVSRLVLLQPVVVVWICSRSPLELAMQEGLLLTRQAFFHWGRAFRIAPMRLVLCQFSDSKLGLRSRRSGFALASIAVGSASNALDR